LRLVVLQPSYLPWLGYFDQMRRADVFVFYDDVQYDRESWRNRNRIKTREGWQWLTVPVRLGGRFGSAIVDVEIDERRDWRRKHLMTLAQSYARAPYLKRYLEGIERILLARGARLVDLNIELTRYLSDELGLTTRCLRSSELGVAGARSERLVDICRALQATHYLTGDAARSYLDETLFEEAGIRVEYHGYRHPSYSQLHGEFLPYMSVVDLLFNCGEDSLEVLKGGDP